MGSDAPRWVVLLAAWTNVFAGITLVIAFFMMFIGLQWAPEGIVNTAIVFHGKGGGHSYYSLTFWMMFAEGVLWCLGGALLCYRCICNENAAGAVSQCIISTGGFFFACSAWGNPAQIISLRYLIPTAIVTEGGSTMQTWVSFSDACPFYGITTFLIATTMGMYSVRGLPKNKIVSPFFGVLCFFIGAWVIGIFTLFIPMLAGGMTSWDDVNGPPCLPDVPSVSPYVEGRKCVLDMPSYAMSQMKIVALLGSLFLLAGGIIFGILDNFLGLPARDGKLLGTSAELVSNAA